MWKSRVQPLIDYIKSYMQFSCKRFLFLTLSLKIKLFSFTIFWILCDLWRVGIICNEQNVFHLRQINKYAGLFIKCFKAFVETSKNIFYSFNQNLIFHVCIQKKKWELWDMLHLQNLLRLCKLDSALMCK